MPADLGSIPLVWDPLCAWTPLCSWNASRQAVLMGLWVKGHPDLGGVDELPFPRTFLPVGDKGWGRGRAGS